MHTTISSLKNPLIKQVLLLQEKSRERRRSGLFVIEGQREIELALKGNYLLNTILYCNEIISDAQVRKLVTERSTQIVEISRDVFSKLAYRATTEGVIAIAESKDLTIGKLDLRSEKPLILVAEAPEKPGNIGALLRTADAAHVDAVLIANPKTDLYNPNIIRSSVGCLFTTHLAYGTTSEIIEFLKARNISIYCAALQGAINYHTCDFKKASAIVVGTEADGLTNEWLENSTENIIIPMQGEIDSLNVSVAAGILIFEAKRQRNFH